MLCPHMSGTIPGAFYGVYSDIGKQASVNSRFKQEDMYTFLSLQIIPPQVMDPSPE